MNASHYFTKLGTFPTLSNVKLEKCSKIFDIALTLQEG